MNGNTIKLIGGSFVLGVGAVVGGLFGGGDASQPSVPERGPKPVQIDAPGGPLHYLERGDCIPLEDHVACKKRLARGR